MFTLTLLALALATYVAEQVYAQPDYQRAEQLRKQVWG